MNRELTDPILAAFENVAMPNLPADAPTDTSVPLLVTFKLDDLLRLKRTYDHFKNVTRPALNDAAG